MQYLYCSVTLYGKLLWPVRDGPCGYRYSMQRASWRVRILDFPNGIDRKRELQLRVTPVGSIHFVWGQAKFS